MSSIAIRTGVLLTVGFLLIVGLGPIQQAAFAARVTATCNNSATDAATINSAISSSAVGDEIVIDGPCSITATIVLSPSRSYRGDSRSTVLKQANGANLAALMASAGWVNNTTTTDTPVSVRSLTLDGNKANNSAATIGLVVRSWQTTIEDLQVLAFGGNGIRVTNESVNGTQITNTQVNGRIANVFVTGSDSSGIWVQDSGNAVTDWYLVDNWIADSGADGIHLDNAAGWVVERNHVYGVANNAIYANRTFGTSVSDNYIEDFGQNSTTGTYYGINATVQGDAATTINGNRVFNFQNEVAGSTYRYLGISQVNYNSGFATVADNVIRGKGTTGTGLYYSKGGATALTVVSTGNNVTGVATQRSVGAGVTVTAGL
ncbi:hypothetical protein GCM10009555_057050 [Acrocarpospora macrocephala]|uniref:Right handed beta helix domain-containing protein n=1 Tax=Acrocarpospora macrocephala TaxID=150177 RepID=A0A5M3WJR7_9ACTN|nr:right-handed parallel beta-helix repeat-containing protein [Acrocarpospora macrocephala]GES08409.1 hypothetical protein Amac_020050 [Acrocarpospora macrocephala]